MADQLEKLLQLVLQRLQANLPPDTLQKLLVDLQKLLASLPPDTPRRVGRKPGARLVCQHVFEVSDRTLERWDEVEWVVVNGKATTDTEALLAAAVVRFAAAIEKQKQKELTTA